MNAFKPMLIACAIILAAGCKQKQSQESSDEEMARGNYTIENNDVTVMTLQRRAFEKQLVCNGRLEARDKASIQFGTSGEVYKVNVREGQQVHKGQVLASLDKDQAERNLRQARLSFDKAEMTLADRLLDYGYTLADTAKIPAEQKRVIYLNSGFLDAKMSLENAELAYSQCELKAPFSGKVAGLEGRAHEQAGKLCTIIDDSRFLVRFSVLETEYGFVREGQKVTISPFADREVSVDGRIVSINPTVGQNGQISVTAEVPGGKGLIDGMNVKVTAVSETPGQLVVPKSAVVIRDGMEVLFRYIDGHARWTYVNVLMSNSTEHAVTANTDRGADLNVGDLVIVTGNLNLGEDSPVTIAD